MGDFMMTKFLAIVVFTVCIVQGAQADNNSKRHYPTPEPEVEIPAFALGTPKTAGSGCPEETVGVSMTEDKKTVSFIFDSFLAEAGNSADLQRNKKRCRVTIPVDVPKGFQVVTVKLDQRGFYLIPENARLLLERKYWLTNKRNHAITRAVTKNQDVRGPAEEEYTKNFKLQVPTLMSPCGEKINFHFDTSVDLKTNTAGEDALATVDSLDVSGDSKGYLVKFFMRRCKK
jgi:hypothetical protein